MVGVAQCWCRIAIWHLRGSIPLRAGSKSISIAMFFVYLLQSLKDKDYYVGQTDDIDERVMQHNHGLVESTKSRRPLILIGYETYCTRSQAMTREQNLKTNNICLIYNAPNLQWAFSKIN